MKFEPLGITGYETISLDLINPTDKELPDPFGYLTAKDIEDALKFYDKQRKE